MKLAILYRGPLSSCNYGCSYCPFAKRRETVQELANDRTALARFVRWVHDSPHELSIFFTPWGEALVRSWYREAVVALSHLPNVHRVAAQTNLSMPLAWLRRTDPAKVGLWSTFHPTQTSRDRFLRQILALAQAGIRTSVGVVGLREHFDEIRALRTELPAGIYLWINAFKRQSDYYTHADRARLEAIDPLFPFNAERHPSLGEKCRTGESAFTVNGDGVIRRCHFVDSPLGNIYTSGWENALMSRGCPNATCGCHIGYVHMERLGLDHLFGEGILERIPSNGPGSEPQW